MYKLFKKALAFIYHVIYNDIKLEYNLTARILKPYMT